LRGITGCSKSTQVNYLSTLFDIFSPEYRRKPCLNCMKNQKNNSPPLWNSPIYLLLLMNFILDDLLVLMPKDHLDILSPVPHCFTIYMGIKLFASSTGKLAPGAVATRTKSLKII